MARMLLSANIPVEGDVMNPGAVVALSGMFVSASAGAIPVGTEYFAGGQAAVQVVEFEPTTFFNDDSGASAEGTTASGLASLSGAPGCSVSESRSTATAVC